MLTAEQLRAGRALVKMPQEELATQCGVSVPTIKRWEGGSGPLTGSAASVAAAQTALEKAGVEFIPENGGGPGVRLHKQQSTSAS